MIEINTKGLFHFPCKAHRILPKSDSWDGARTVPLSWRQNQFCPFFSIISTFFQCLPFMTFSMQQFSPSLCCSPSKDPSRLIPCLPELYSREAHPEKLSSHCLLSQGHCCPGGGRLQQAAWAASLPSTLVHAWWIGQDVQPIKSKNPSLLCDLGNLSGQFHCRPCHNELFVAQQEDTLRLFMT